MFDVTQGDTLSLENLPPPFLVGKGVVIGPVTVSPSLRHHRVGEVVIARHVEKRHFQLLDRGVECPPLRLDGGFLGSVINLLFFNKPLDIII